MRDVLELQKKLRPPLAERPRYSFNTWLMSCIHNITQRLGLPANFHGEVRRAPKQHSAGSRQNPAKTAGLGEWLLYVPPQSRHLSCQNGRIPQSGQLSGHCVQIVGFGLVVGIVDKAYHLTMKPDIE